MVDWRRRAGRRSNVADLGLFRRHRGWLTVVGVAVAATLIVGGTHFLFSSSPSGTHNLAAATPSAVPSLPPSTSSSAEAASGLVAVTEAPTPTVSATPTPTTTTPTTAATTSRPHSAAPTHSSAPSKSTAPGKAKPVTPKPGKTVSPTHKPVKPSPTPPVAPLTGTGTVVGLNGMCLDVNGASANDGTLVQIYTCNGTGAQSWTAQNNGTVQAYGKCLTATGGAGSTMQLTGCNGSPAQQWQLISGTVVNSAEGLCLDVQGGNSGDRTPTVAATCSGGPGQIWRLG